MIATFALPYIDLGQVGHAKSTFGIATITLPGYSE
jgi:hypothetical protein